MGFEKKKITKFIRVVAENADSFFKYHVLIGGNKRTWGC